MSESLLFAILGFLIACLFGTVVASFLWRRAVTVTKRKLGLTGNEGDDQANADAQIEIDDLRRQLGERDIKIRNLKSESELRTQDQAANEAEARDEVKRQLTSAARELEKAANEKAKLSAELAAATERSTALEDALSNQNERVTTLETAIRTLVTSAGLPSIDTSSDEATPENVNQDTLSESASETETPEAEMQAATPDASAETTQSDTVADVETVTPDASSLEDEDEKTSNTLVASVSRSLDDRIQALVQGQKPH